jgi:hypothetical protein
MEHRSMAVVKMFAAPDFLTLKFIIALKDVRTSNASG